MAKDVKVCFQTSVEQRLDLEMGVLGFHTLCKVQTDKRLVGIMMRSHVRIGNRLCKEGHERILKFCESTKGKHELDSGYVVGSR